MKWRSHNSDNPVAVLCTAIDGALQYGSLWMWCPGCDGAHRVNLKGRDTPAICWEWDGNLEAPTISPSILCHTSVHLCPENYEHTYVCDDPKTCGEPGHLVLGQNGHHRILGHNNPHAVDPAWGSCHSFVRSGRWEFLTDSAHSLAGQTVPMVPLPDWLLSGCTAS